MARGSGEQVLRSSVLDRLCGTHGVKSAYGSVGLRELKQAVARDLEWLLNTRCGRPGDLELLDEARRSLLAYGIPDLSVYSWSSAEDRREICALIEETIKTFEPRLVPRTVKISLVKTEAVDDFRVHLRIDAVLHVEPYTEPVSFDTDIEVHTGAVDVRGAD